ncbi:MAG: hypothetical protein LC804_26680 [Acidobacteria bacterium]|nr:hypothetical protein [Acidobacteriota bacterium]
MIPELPYSFDFESATGDAPPRHWINATGKYTIREVEGNKVLVRLVDNTPARRTRTYFGDPKRANYTIEVDLRTTEGRRQMGDAGVIAQRYALVLFGNGQRVELQPWQPATAMTVSAPFKWQPNTWYRVKLRVANGANGVTTVQGKAWPKGEPEPGAWLVEKTDRIGHREGSPGIYADPLVEIFFDNITVTRN